MSSYDKWKKLDRRDGRWLQDVRLEGEMLSVEEAIRRAEENGLDAVLVNKWPPVVKLMDLGKFIYEQKKKEKDQKQSAPRKKEMKFHLGVGENDYLHKMKQIGEFLADGDIVSVKLILRGREGKTDLVNAFVRRLEEDLKSLPGKMMKGSIRNGNVVEMIYAGEKKKDA